MITLNGKKLAETEDEFINSLFETGGTCVGYAKRFKRKIDIMDARKNKVGVINRELVLGAATKVEGGYWYSYADVKIIGEYNSYMAQHDELRDLTTGWDHIGYKFK